MVLGLFEKVAQEASSSLVSHDISGLVKYISFPFTLIENEFTLVFKSEEDLIAFSKLIFDTAGEIEFYKVVDPSIIPIGGSIYSCTYTMTISFTNGIKSIPAKRGVVLREKDGNIKVVSSICFADTALTQIAQTHPEVIEEIRTWGK